MDAKDKSAGKTPANEEFPADGSDIIGGPTAAINKGLANHLAKNKQSCVKPKPKPFVPVPSRTGLIAQRSVSSARAIMQKRLKALADIFGDPDVSVEDADRELHNIVRDYFPGGPPEGTK